MRSVLNRSRENRNPRELDAAERRNRMAEKVYRKSPEVTKEMLERLEETKKRNDIRLPPTPTIEDLVREGMSKGRRHIYTTTDPEYDDDRLKQQLQRTMEHYVRPTDYY